MADIVDPYNFAAGELADAEQVDARFAAVLAQVNGNLDNTNVAALAAIAASKIAPPSGGYVTVASNLNNGNLPFERTPSATRVTHVVVYCSIQSAAGTGSHTRLDASVGGVVVGALQQSAPPGEIVGQLMSFYVPPGTAYKLDRAEVIVGPTGSVAVAKVSEWVL